VSETVDELRQRLFEKVQKHMEWDDAKTMLWFHTMNPHIGNSTPNFFISLKPVKAEKWIDSLIEENSAPLEEFNRE
jgi:hypothetical protein